MANTNGTVQGTLIAQRALKTLLVRFPILALITTDFTPEAVKFNQQVVSHVVTATTAADYNPATGYVAVDRTQVDVPVSINKHKHHTYGVNDQERTSTEVELIERYALTAAHALGKAMVDDLMALVVNANFPNSMVITAANFSRAKVIDVGTELNKLFVSDIDRFMLLNSDYYAALCKDSDIARADANSGANTIRSGQLTNVHGFGIAEYAGLPTNAENLTGFAGNREGMVLTARVPELPQVNNLPGIIYNVTDPDTKLTVQVRQWYDMGLGKEFRTYTLMYGVAKGVANNVYRIKSA